MNDRLIEVKPYRLKLRTPYRWSKGTQYERTGLILRLQRDMHVGWGEAALPPHIAYPPDAFAAECRSLLAGLNPHDENLLDELRLGQEFYQVRQGFDRLEGQRKQDTHKETSGLISEFRVEYMRLFVGPATPLAAPYESFYRKDPQRQNQKGLLQPFHLRHKCLLYTAYRAR